MLADVRKRAGEFDVIHFHLSHFLHFPFFEEMAGRTVTTPHGRLDYVDLAPAYERFPRFPMISISPQSEARTAGRQLARHHPSRVAARRLPPDL